MAHQSVPALPLSRNEISSLAQLFQTAFTYYYQHDSPFLPDYLHQLSTAVGLGFVPVLVDGEAVSVYQGYLNTFLRYRAIKAHPDALPTLALAVAEMVHWAALVFRLLDYPAYYESFAAAVKKITAGSLSGRYGDWEVAQRVNAQRVLEVILPKVPWR